jgi:hypothetical protein
VCLPRPQSAPHTRWHLLTLELDAGGELERGVEAEDLAGLCLQVIVAALSDGADEAVEGLALALG